MHEHRVIEETSSWSWQWTIATVLLVCVPLTIGAVKAFPLWDDGWLQLLIKESGVSAIIPSVPDRPLMASLWRLLATSDRSLWLFGYVLQAICWPVLGIQAAMLWKRLFPELKRYCPLVACLTVAPIVVQVQMTIINVTFAALLPTIMGYGALLLLLRYVDGDRYGIAPLFLALIIAIAGTLISEYTLPVAGAAIVLIWTRGRKATDVEKKARALKGSVLLAGAVIIAYATFLITGSSYNRPNVNPIYLTSNPKFKLFAFPIGLLFSIGDSVLIAYARALGSITNMSLLDKQKIAALLYGAVVAVVAAVACRQSTNAKSLSVEKHGRDIFLLFISLAIGLAPVVLMGRQPYREPYQEVSRFYIPVMPIAASLTLLLIVTMVRPRFLLILVVLAGVVAGNSALNMALTVIRQQSQLTKIGAIVKPFVSTNESNTVLVVPFDAADYELTAKVSAAWPVELSKRVWVLGEKQARNVLGARGGDNRPDKLDQNIRLVVRNGHIDQFLYVPVPGNSSPFIEPYYITEASRSSKN